MVPFNFLEKPSKNTSKWLHTTLSSRLIIGAASEWPRRRGDCEVDTADSGAAHDPGDPKLGGLGGPALGTRLLHTLCLFSK